MARRRFFWQLYVLFIALTVIVFAAASEYAAHGFRKFYFAHAEQDLASRARLAAELMRGELAQPEAGIDAFCKEIGHRATIRLTVVRPDGLVLADTEADPATMDNHARRPEIMQALTGQTGRSVRHSDTTRDERMYVAVPLEHDGKLLAVIRTSIPTAPLARALSDFQNRLAATAVILGILVMIAVFIFLRRITRPLSEMRHGARRFADGDLNFRLRAPNYEEFGELADALNTMAVQLQNRIEATARQRDEMQAVFASMREAVIAVDAAENILQINAAAASLLGIDDHAAAGQMLAGIMRNSELLRLLRTALEKRESAEGEITVIRPDDGERILQVNATPVRNPAGAILGAMIVANDITQLRKLERVRRDFVANVSHELKTPLTSIKGFVETLQEGALEQPDEARRFLGIVARQVARLQAVLADLLSLSRIEQQHEHKELRFQDGDIRPALQSAIELCADRAAQKQMTITLDCPTGARSRINADLLEQAAVNLIENAIKYSEPGRPIHIAAAPADGGWRIDFTDHGNGIEPQHLDRIFERFYRVDKSRSRSDGGTGLGLSIVKHIMSAHNGRVTVTSQYGHGSTFTLHLPASPAQ